MKSHHFECRVYIEDTDAGGIVYYANYLSFSERARTEAVRSLGIDHASLIKNFENPIIFAVCHCEIDYFSPARLDDVLEIVTYIVEVRKASFVVNQVIVLKETNQKLACLKVKLACVSLKEGKPLGLPENIKICLKRCL